MTLAKPNEQMGTLQIQVRWQRVTEIDAGCGSGTGTSVMFVSSQPCLSVSALLIL